MRLSCCIQIALISGIFLFCGGGFNSKTKLRWHFNPPFSYHTLEVGPFPLYGDNEYRFDLSKLKIDRRSQVMIYYSFAFPNEDSESHRALLDANFLELDIWNGEGLVYSFRGFVPYGDYGGKKQSNGEWGFEAKKENLKEGDYCLSGKIINQKCTGRLRIKSSTHQK